MDIALLRNYYPLTEEPGPPLLQQRQQQPSRTTTMEMDISEDLLNDDERSLPLATSTPMISTQQPGASLRHRPVSFLPTVVTPSSDIFDHNIPDRPIEASPTTVSFNATTGPSRKEYRQGEFEGLLNPGHHEYLEQCEKEQDHEEKIRQSEMGLKHPQKNIKSSLWEQYNIGVYDEEQEEGHAAAATTKEGGYDWKRFEIQEPKKDLKIKTGTRTPLAEEDLRKLMSKRKARTFGNKSKTVRFDARTKQGGGGYKDVIQEEEDDVTIHSKENCNPDYHAPMHNTMTTTTTTTVASYAPFANIKWPPDTPTPSRFKTGGLSSPESVGGMTFATVPRELFHGENGTDVDDFGRAFFVNIVPGYTGRNTHLREDEWVDVAGMRGGGSSGGGKKRVREDDEYEE